MEANNNIYKSPTRVMKNPIHDAKISKENVVNSVKKLDFGLRLSVENVDKVLDDPVFNGVLVAMASKNGVMDKYLEYEEMKSEFEISQKRLAEALQAPRKKKKSPPELIFNLPQF